MGTTTRSSHLLSDSWAESTWTACPAMEWWGPWLSLDNDGGVIFLSLSQYARLTCDMFPSSPGGAESTQSSPCCRSSGDSCCSRRTWSSASPLRAPPIRRRMRLKTVELKRTQYCLVLNYTESSVLTVLHFSLIQSANLNSVFTENSSINHRIILYWTQTTLSDNKISLLYSENISWEKWLCDRYKWWF